MLLHLWQWDWFYCSLGTGVVESIAASSEGALLCTVGDDQAMKVFDVVNFDMINMMKLGYVQYGMTTSWQLHS